MDIYISEAEFSVRAEGVDVAVFSLHSTSSGYAASHSRPTLFYNSQKEKAKREKYRILCAHGNMKLNPMVMDIYGAIGDGLQTGVRPIFSFMAPKRGTSPVEEHSNLLSRLFCLVV